MNIDSHVHFWKYDKKRDAWITAEMKTLQQDYLPDNLTLTFKRNQIDGCVAVQASQSELETLFLTELSKTNLVIKGVVGWIDLQSDQVQERLHYFSQFPVIRGYRHIVQAEPAGFLLGERFQHGVSLLKEFGYTYDILVYPSQLNDAIKFVSKLPGQKLIIDHCAKPEIRNGKIDEWKEAIGQIARYPDVYCKLSGLFTEAKWNTWSAGEFYPYLDVVFEAFGTDRLLFGSDWPVMLLSGIYVQWKSLLEKYIDSHVPDEKEKIFGLNAIQFYGLQP